MFWEQAMLRGLDTTEVEFTFVQHPRQAWCLLGRLPSMLIQAERAVTMPQLSPLGQMTSSVSVAGKSDGGS